MGETPCTYPAYQPPHINSRWFCFYFNFFVLIFLIRIFILSTFILKEFVLCMGELDPELKGWVLGMGRAQKGSPFP